MSKPLVGESKIVPTPKPGEVLVVGKRMYSPCSYCGTLVWINKPLFGGLHVCGDPPQ